MDSEQGLKGIERKYRKIALKKWVKKAKRENERSLENAKYFSTLKMKKQSIRVTRIALSSTPIQKNTIQK